MRPRDAIKTGRDQKLSLRKRFARAFCVNMLEGPEYGMHKKRLSEPKIHACVGQNYAYMFDEIFQQEKFMEIFV